MRVLDPRSFDLYLHTSRLYLPAFQPDTRLFQGSAAMSQYHVPDN